MLITLDKYKAIINNNNLNLMEKSLIHDFKSSTSSLRQSTVLGTNSMLAHRSSSKEHDQLYLHRSRIKHLPADKNEDLTTRLDFVIVFQSIEISRLTQEIAFLRGRLRQIDGKNFNTGSYEVQIRELMEKCNKLQNEKYSYREELSQTKDVSENIYHELSLLKSRYADVDFCVAEKYKLEKARNQQLCLEIEKWKSRYNSLDKNKQEQLDGYKRMLEVQKDSMLNRESKQLLSRFQIERQQLMAKLRERKEHIDEKQLEITKLMNFYEQAQVRAKQDQSKIEEYQQKVAMLSQETLRLNELVRMKHQDIKNLKSVNEQDYSMRMSQFTSLDQTKNHLNNKVRAFQDENDQLREENRKTNAQLMILKQRLIQTERIEFQLKQSKEEIQNKNRSIERKDKKIFNLQDQLRQSKNYEIENRKNKEIIVQMSKDLQFLQKTLDAKLQELQVIKQKQRQFMKWRDQYEQKLNSKVSMSNRQYDTLEANYRQIKTTAEQNHQKSMVYELKMKEIAIQFKEKDYMINSLQNELRLFENKLNNKSEETIVIIKRFQDQILMERHNYQMKIKDVESKNQIRIRENQYINRQAEQKRRQLQLKTKQFQGIRRDYQYKLKQFEQEFNNRDRDNMELRKQLSSMSDFQKGFENRYLVMSKELKSLQSRLQTIQKIIASLKSNLMSKFKLAQEHQQQMRFMDIKYQQMYQWFCQKMKDYERNNNRNNDSPNGRSGFAYQHQNNSFQQSSHFFTNNSYNNISPHSKDRSKYNENVNQTNTLKSQSIPISMLISHVLVCAQVQQLRKRVGDKNAKVESMRNSIATKSQSNLSQVSQFIGSPTGGFYTTRQSSLNRKNIYY